MSKSSFLPKSRLSLSRGLKSDGSSLVTGTPLPDDHRQCPPDHGQFKRVHHEVKGHNLKTDLAGLSGTEFKNSLSVDVQSMFATKLVTSDCGLPTAQSTVTIKHGIQSSLPGEQCMLMAIQSTTTGELCKSKGAQSTPCSDQFISVDTRSTLSSEQCMSTSKQHASLGTKSVTTSEQCTSAGTPSCTDSTPNTAIAGVQTNVTKTPTVLTEPVEECTLSSPKCMLSTPIHKMLNPVRLGMPSIRPNAMSNRQRQLETLRHYEDKIRRSLAITEPKKPSEFLPQQPPRRSDPLDHPMPSSRTPAANPMYIHTLDLSEALTDGLVSWQQIREETCINAPEETIFYSLVEGRGELVLFGGIQGDLHSMQRGLTLKPQAVSDDVYYLTIKRTIR